MKLTIERLQEDYFIKREPTPNTQYPRVKTTKAFMAWEVLKWLGYLPSTLAAVMAVLKMEQEQINLSE